MRYEHVGKDRDMQSISNQAGGGGSMATPTINASQIKSLDLGRRDKPDYFALTGTFVYCVCVCVCVGGWVVG